LRSANTRVMLLVSGTPTNFSNRAFSAAGSAVWNNLPVELSWTCHTAVSGSRWKVFIWAVKGKGKVITLI